MVAIVERVKSRAAGDFARASAHTGISNKHNDTRHVSTREPRAATRGTKKSVAEHDTTHLLDGADFSFDDYDEYIESTDDTTEAENEDEEESDVDNAIRQYLGEIGRYPLLTAEQEMHIARRMLKGDMQAQQQLVEENLRLFVSIAKRYNNHGI